MFVSVKRSTQLLTGQFTVRQFPVRQFPVPQFPVRQHGQLPVLHFPVLQCPPLRSRPSISSSTNSAILIRAATADDDKQWRRQDLLRGGAKLEIRSWGTHDKLQGRVQ